MKRITSFFILLALVIACNSNDSKENKSASEQETQEAPSDPEAEKGLQLIAKNDCFQCHDVSAKKIGPEYMTVAAKYKNADAALRDTLATRIIKGSTGHWGTVPMTPHPDLSLEDARTMIHYVLSLK